MKRTIKSIVKLMSFGFIGLALLSCSKNETPAVQEKAIGFNSYTGRAVTKADASLITGSVLPEGKESHFTVYAWNTGEDYWADEATAVFMRGQKVTYNGEGNVVGNYDYKPLRYWPKPDGKNKLTFFAYYPFDAFTPNDIPEDGWGDYSFSVKTDPADMVDLCVSDVVKDQVYTEDNQGIVPFVFHHALTMVKFQVVTDAEYYKENDQYKDTKITLTEFKVEGVSINGTLTPSLITSTSNPAWVASTTTGTFDLTPEEPLLVPYPEAVTLPTGTPDDDACLMIPQKFINETAKVTVSYEVKTGSEDKVTNTVTVYLKDATVTEWKQRMNIVYTFTIGLKPIRFTATVEPWLEEEVPVTIQ